MANVHDFLISKGFLWIFKLLCVFAKEFSSDLGAN